MNVVFFRHFESYDDGNSPFSHILEQQKVSNTIFFGGYELCYTRRLWLLLFGWPRLFWFAFIRTVYYLLFCPKTDAVVAWTHLELLPTILLRRLFWGTRPKIVLVGFIFTHRENSWLQWLRYKYFHWLLKHVDKIIVHSKLEAYDYRQLFGVWDHRFVFQPFGTFVNLVEYQQPAKEPYVFSAGRSGRDYEVLLSAFEHLPYKLHIACDSLFPGHYNTDNICIMHDCYKDKYLRELTQATIVVVPLKEHWISAGQMVLIEAMALSKTVIVTRTETSSEYVEHNKNVWFVPMGNSQELSDAVTYLMEHPEVRERIGAQARELYIQQYSIQAATVRLCNLLEQLNPHKVIPCPADMKSCTADLNNSPALILNEKAK